MPLETMISRREKLDDRLKAEMYGLMTRAFDNIDEKIFQRDLEEKDWVILLKDGSGKLSGFSTIQVFTRRLDGISRKFLFSGDTIVDRSHWRESTLACGFANFLFRMIARNPGEELYWFLISKGYRTYRYLPVFFREFFPVYNSPTPAFFRKMLDDICRNKFGVLYNPATGIIECAGISDHLKPELCEVNGRAHRDPHVAFFMAKNPQFARGDELACITAISHDNFTQPAYRVVNQAGVYWDE